MYLSDSDTLINRQSSRFILNLTDFIHIAVPLSCINPYPRSG